MACGLLEEGRMWSPFKKVDWGAWVAQSGKCLTSAQVMISQCVGLSPISGSVLTAGAWSLLQSLRLPLSMPSPYLHSLSKLK